MEKYSITVASRAVADSLNNKIAIDSLFEKGESITGEPLHPGVNYTDDRRVYDSANEYAKDHKGVRGYERLSDTGDNVFQTLQKIGRQ